MNKNLKINGIGMAVPHKVYTNEDIQRITPNSKADWIEDKLGIKQRHVCTTENVVELGFQAAQQALTMADMLNYF
jgi:3-oxoacyl-[acyl-carrier-protein] synthase-3